MKALLYDALMAPLGWMGLTEARQRLVAGVHSKVLEVGAGTGLALPGYPEDVDSITALDIDPDALVRARKRRPGVQIALANVQDLPFRDRSFDFVIASLVFCSVEDPARGLAELHRVLRIDGQLRMLEHVRSPNPKVSRLQERLTPAWCRMTGGCRLNRDTFPLVQAAGFYVTRRVSLLDGLAEEITAVRVKK
ncbi:class I SAM-dependent methyltransferase [Hyalangium rubrum]|uniref:Class I SAM-dependent methyltransferase n=1 Tax=Hyalangium rubrum TaxID=3103134 RepID=A0ABU5H0B5_9BACT|nr:class I SAM-dependent methyltransferase [Hyalangium sp. s54d21]MDY7226379.1 class I SAM-dependent methyltransferase [Hyalangium sp. s54d21]